MSVYDARSPVLNAWMLVPLPVVLVSLHPRGMLVLRRWGRAAQRARHGGGVGGGHPHRPEEGTLRGYGTVTKTEERTLTDRRREHSQHMVQ